MSAYLLALIDTKTMMVVDAMIASQSEVMAGKDRVWVEVYRYETRQTSFDDCVNNVISIMRHEWFSGHFLLPLLRNRGADYERRYQALQQRDFRWAARQKLGSARRNRRNVI